MSIFRIVCITPDGARICSDFAHCVQCAITFTVTLQRYLLLLLSPAVTVTALAPDPVHTSAHERSVATPQETAADCQGWPQRNPGRYRLRAYFRGDPGTAPGARHQAERGGPGRDLRGQPHHHSSRIVASGPRGCGLAASQSWRRGGQPQR